MTFEERYVILQRWMHALSGRRFSFAGAWLSITLLIEAIAVANDLPWPVHAGTISLALVSIYFSLGFDGFAEGYELRSLLLEVQNLPRNLAEPLLLRVEGLLVANQLRLPRAEMHAVCSRARIELECLGIGDSSKARAVAEAKKFLGDPPVLVGAAALDPQLVKLIERISNLSRKSK